DHFFQHEGFPRIDPFACTNDCREKMKSHFQFKTQQILEWTTRYFEDARTIEDQQGQKDDHSYKPNLNDYWGFFHGRPLGELERKIIKNMKVGLLNGEPIRLCDLPEGTKCDFDATNLEE
ncbi:hypothetical protein DICPUDRAFT_22089, partial [Dictyostelium purpureum]